MVLNKTQRVNPFIPVTQYIKGTEAPNYYLVVHEDGTAIVGFRPLNQAIPPVGSQPQVEVPTRVRVVPHSDSDTESLAVLMGLLDLTEKQHPGESEIHYSVVTNNAPKLIEKIKTALTLFDL